MKKRTETTTETHEVWIVRRSPSPLATSPLWCQECTQRAALLSPEDAARRIGVNPRTIYRWVECGVGHFREIDDGWLLVCTASLLAAEAAPATRFDAPPAPS